MVLNVNGEPRDARHGGDNRPRHRSPLELTGTSRLQPWCLRRVHRTADESSRDPVCTRNDVGERPVTTVEGSLAEDPDGAARALDAGAIQRGRTPGLRGAHGAAASNRGPP